MAAFGLPGGIEWMICAIPLLVTGIIIAVVVSLAKKKPSVPMRKCAVCDNEYDARYDACPHCAKVIV